MSQLTVIENKNQPQVIEYVPSIAQTVEQAAHNLKEMHALVKKVMRYKVDYDTIPGTPKPSLLKPGAERLLQFFGLGHQVECVNKTEDWNGGFFFYHYKVTVIKTYPTHKLIVAECEGSANSKEKRYRNQDVYTIVNTLQKMAIKRALVGATLQATGSSGLFTQDVEDMDLHESTEKPQRSNQPARNQQQASDSNGLASEAQVKAMYAIGSKNGLSNDDVKALASETFGREIASTKELTKGEASKLIELLQNGGGE